MAGTDASARIAVEVLVEQQVLAPVRVGLKGLVRAEDWASPVLSTQEDVRQPARELICDLPGGEFLARAGGTFHQEIFVIIMVELLERFDQVASDCEAASTARSSGRRSVASW
jgi:hypothetical protein